MPSMLVLKKQVCDQSCLNDHIKVDKLTKYQIEGANYSRNLDN